MMNFHSSTFQSISILCIICISILISGVESFIYRLTLQRLKTTHTAATVPLLQRRRFIHKPIHQSSDAETSSSLISKFSFTTVDHIRDGMDRVRDHLHDLEERIAFAKTKKLQTDSLYDRQTSQQQQQQQPLPIQQESTEQIHLDQQKLLQLMGDDGAGGRDDTKSREEEREEEEKEEEEELSIETLQEEKQKAQTVITGFQTLEKIIQNLSMLQDHLHSKDEKLREKSEKYYAILQESRHNIEQELQLYMMELSQNDENNDHDEDDESTNNHELFVKDAEFVDYLK